MSKDRRSTRPARARIQPACEGLETRTLLSRATPQYPTYVDVEVRGPSRFVMQQSDEALITLHRWGLTDQELSVAFKTTPPTDPVVVPGKAGVVAATAGEHYLAVDKVVSFPRGQSDLTLSVPIVRGAANPGIALMGISAKAVMSEGQLLANGREAKGEIAIVSGPDQLPLAITDARLVRQASGTSAVTMTFSQPMERSSVENLGTYRILRKTRAGVTLSTPPIRLQSATYDDATETLTLVTKKPLNPASVYEVVIGTRSKASRRGQPPPPNPVVLSSQTGNPLTLTQPLPANPATTPILLATRYGSIVDARSPASFKVTGTSSGPPALGYYAPPIDIHYSLGYTLAHMLIPI